VCLAQSVITPTCHTGGRGFESRRSRQLSAYAAPWVVNNDRTSLVTITSRIAASLDGKSACRTEGLEWEMQAPESSGACS